MYVILRNNEDISKYQDIKKIDLHEYTSKDVELISKDELEEIVMKYLKKYLARGGFNNSNIENVLSTHYLQKKKSKTEFKKFNDLRSEDIDFDFHIHTNYTDGHSTPEEIIDRAIGLKLKTIAFSEHVNKTSGWFNEFSERINSLKKNDNLKIFLGIETKALDFNGNLDATPDMITNSDIVVGVVHRYSDGKGGLIPLEEIKNLGLEKAAEIEFRLALGLLENKDINVLGHPFGVYSKFFTNLPEDYMRKLMEKAVEKNIAIEINTKYLLENEKFFRLLREINPYVSIGSDAHNTEEVARDFDIIRKEVGK
jgi:putative hydrolase